MVPSPEAEVSIKAMEVARKLARDQRKNELNAGRVPRAPGRAQPCTRAGKKQDAAAAAC